MAKGNIYKTFGPIHFEDLEPHRFEDLVRELIYDFRDWQSIEATGKGGSDDGFDIRAYEKVNIPFDSFEDEDNQSEILHPMEGNLWMVQCKREVEIGPKKVEKIVSDVDPNNPPYGYILVASANFSKKAYDVFREQLRKKGVMEFYLWGKSELEDQLYMPKNDRILFTFFGISLTSKRKSLVNEVRARVLIKNKLYRILGQDSHINRQLIVRDLNDETYPRKRSSKENLVISRWEEYHTKAYNTQGIWCLVKEHFAYIDLDAKEWDIAETIDLVFREDKLREGDIERESSNVQRLLISDFCEYLPKDTQARYEEWGLIKFDDISFIDEKGDIIYDCPHIYLDFKPTKGPFSRFLSFIDVGHEQIDITKEEYKRVRKFPETYSKIEKGKIYREKAIEFDPVSMRYFKDGNNFFYRFYDADDKYEFLQQRDIIYVKGSEENGEKKFIKITYKEKSQVASYLYKKSVHKSEVERMVGRDLNDDEEITIFEFKTVYYFED